MALTESEVLVKDYAAISMPSLHPFISNQLKIYEAIDDSRVNPFSDESLLLDQIFYPERETQYFIHIDAALTGDRLGIAMSHIPYFVYIQRTENASEYRTELVPFVWVDFVGGVKANRGEEIQLGEIREIIYTLTRRGFFISMITMDGFQSADTIQILIGKGYQAGRLSIDRTSRIPLNRMTEKGRLVYVPSEDILCSQNALKLSLMENRISFPYNEILIKEFKTAQLDLKKMKVDHPPGGSIDVEQAVVGASFMAMYNTPVNSKKIGKDWKNGLSKKQEVLQRVSGRDDSFIEKEQLVLGGYKLNTDEIEKRLKASGDESLGTLDTFIDEDY